MSETIVGAALKFDKLTISGPRRHADLFREVGSRFGKYWLHEMSDPECQGFLTSEGRFVGRTEAAEIALRAGQVQTQTLIQPPHLFSEDLW